MKAVLRAKFIAIQIYLKNIEIFQINNLTIYQKNLRNNNKDKPEQIINIRTELNDIETKSTILRMNKSIS